MNIRIRINGAFVTVDATEEVCCFLMQAKRKEENLRHEQRRHWEQRGFDETALVIKHGAYSSTPEQWLLRRERLEIIHATLMQCTPTQRRRFLLYALDGWSYAEIGQLCNCSKTAAQDSVEAVRKKIQKNLK